MFSCFLKIINKTVNSFVTAFMFSCVLKNINKTVNSFFMAFKGCCVIRNNISKTDVQIVIAVVADYSNLLTF
jgi:hypothetical protein